MFSKTLARMAIVLAVASATMPMRLISQTLTIHDDQSGPVINRDIFGQFAEHLGQGIYGGVWVGKDSKIANVRGVRTDVVQALKAIKVPVVRWPGGCFADKYHWRDGVGPIEKRAKTVNVDWGNAHEPNTFGTDEFMDFIGQIGSEAYLSVNLGSGTVEEAAAWLSYMTGEEMTTLGAERAANGHRAPYFVKYLGVGNESWGCGGSMSPDAYVERMKLFSTFVRSSNPSQIRPGFFTDAPEPMQRVASGDGGAGTEYTEALMKAAQSAQPYLWGLEGLSLHSYTFGKTPLNEPATGFSENGYASFLKETLNMDDLIAKRSAIMDKYDPKKKVSLVVDEWGSWLKPMPGLNVMFLKQQNSLRDAILASLNLNIFARHADRVRMTEIAQMVNVLQSMILTDNEKMLLTPTYYIYKMYLPFQDSQFIPISFDAGEYTVGDVSLPRVDAIAARGKDGKIWVALTNIDPNRPIDVTTNLHGVASKGAVGEVLTGERIDSIDTFELPSAVKPTAFNATASEGKLVLHLLPKSVTVVRLEE